MEAYLKKLCFEYQVEEKEVKELLARMERVYLDKGETIASATMPEQSLYIIVSGILHTFTTQQGEDKTVRFLSEVKRCISCSQETLRVSGRRLNSVSKDSSIFQTAHCISTVLCCRNNPIVFGL